MLDLGWIRRRRSLVLWFWLMGVLKGNLVGTKRKARSPSAEPLLGICVTGGHTGEAAIIPKPRDAWLRETLVNRDCLDVSVSSPWSPQRHRGAYLTLLPHFLRSTESLYHDANA